MDILFVLLLVGLFVATVGLVKAIERLGESS